MAVSQSHGKRSVGKRVDSALHGVLVSVDFSSGEGRGVATLWRKKLEVELGTLMIAPTPRHGGAARAELLLHLHLDSEEPAPGRGVGLLGLPHQLQVAVSH